NEELFLAARARIESNKVENINIMARTRGTIPRKRHSNDTRTSSTSPHVSKRPRADESDSDEPDTDDSDSHDESSVDEPVEGLDIQAAKKKANEQHRKHELEDQWPEKKWCPPKYLPTNPDCPIIISSMNSLTKRWKALGREPQELWKDNGIMVRAIGEGGSRTSKFLTQRTFSKARRMLTVVEEEARQDANENESGPSDGGAAGEIREDEEEEEEEEEEEKPDVKHKPSRKPLDTALTNGMSVGSGERMSAKEPATSPSPTPTSPLPKKLEAEEGSCRKPNNLDYVADTSAHPPARPLARIADVGSAAGVLLQPVPLQSPRRLDDPTIEAVVLRLERGDRLKSIDMSMCVEILAPSRHWRVFEPGYPFGPLSGSGRRLRVRRILPSHLAFFCGEGEHWSLCHVDTRISRVHHYNSMAELKMPLHSLEQWLQVNGIAHEVTIVQEECPQQDDHVNCGIFALAFLKSLLESGDIDILSPVDPQALRSFFADKLRHRAMNETMLDNKHLSRSETDSEYIMYGPDDSPGPSTAPTTATSTATSQGVLASSWFVSPEPKLALHSVESSGLAQADASHLPQSPSSTQPLEAAQPVAVPGPGHLEDILLDRDPAASGAAKEAMAHVEAFLSKRDTFKADAARTKQTLAERLKALERMKQELAEGEEVLAIQQQLTQDLESEIMTPESVEQFGHELRAWIAARPASSHRFSARWLDKIAAATESSLEDMAAQGDSMAAQLRAFQQACASQGQEVERLEGQILRCEASVEDLKKALQENQAELGVMRQMCLKVMAEDGGMSGGEAEDG
ncbi:hypothetical protein FZEAL_3329, partial [Fusarium zealandicum]